MPASWMGPAARVHEEKFGPGSFPYGQFGRYVKGLALHYSPEQIAEHYACYLEATPPQYLNYARFAQTFLHWQPKPRVADDGLLLE